MKHPLIPDQRVALAAGGVLFVLGAFLLYDAWDGRGQSAPWPLGAVMPF